MEKLKQKQWKTPIIRLIRKQWSTDQFLNFKIKKKGCVESYESVI
jgi:hypothetical protein